MQHCPITYSPWFTLGSHQRSILTSFNNTRNTGTNSSTRQTEQTQNLNDEMNQNKTKQNNQPNLELTSPPPRPSSNIRKKDEIPCHHPPLKIKVPQTTKISKLGFLSLSLTKSKNHSHLITLALFSKQVKISKSPQVRFPKVQPSITYVPQFSCQKVPIMQIARQQTSTLQIARQKIAILQVARQQTAILQTPRQHTTFLQVARQEAPILQIAR